jgi:spore coat protein A
MQINRRKLLLGGGAAAVSAIARFTPSAHALPALPMCSGGRVSAHAQPASSSVTPAAGATPELLQPQNLARFVDPLPVPSVCAAAGRHADPHGGGETISYYRLSMRETEQRLHRDLPPTRVWTYGDSVPGPTIETRSSEPLLVEWINDLPSRHFLPIDHSLHGTRSTLPDVRTVTHVHGAKVPPENDGYPDDWFTRGRSALYRYPNAQDAALLWYHDHAMGIERLNQYAGLFGLFTIRDEHEDALALPRGAYELPLVVFDRLLDKEGQLYYPRSSDPEGPWVPEVYGDAILVNGKLYPFAEIEPRIYRLRVLNASNARFLNLAFSDHRTFHVIGSDQGLLPSPVEVAFLSLAPAERADLLVDFSNLAGSEVRLKTQTFELMQFRVRTRKTGTPRNERLPAVLRPIRKIPEASAVRTRTLSLDQHMEPNGNRMQMFLNRTPWSAPVTETPRLDSVEIWSLVNLTDDIHPIHLHLVRFQILDRRYFDVGEYTRSATLRCFGPVLPPSAHEAGWKDTVQAHAGMVTRIIVRFEGFVGRYVWHCHILEHAANQMMRPFEIVAS